MVICGPYPAGPETGLKPGPPVCSFLRCLAHKAPRGHHFIWVAWEVLHDAVWWVTLSLHFFQKWESVKLLYVKTEKSASLPIFSSFVSIQDDAELQALRQKKNVSGGAEHSGGRVFAFYAADPGMIPERHRLWPQNRTKVKEFRVPLSELAQ